MRICILTTSYPRSETDPSGNFVAALAEELQRRGDTMPTVYAPGCAEAPARETVRGVPVRRLTYFLPRRWQKLAYGEGIPWNLRASKLAWLNIPFFLGAFARSALAAGWRADIIHAHWGILGALAIVLRPFHRRPVAVSIQGSDLASKMSLIRRVTEFAIRRADAVMTPSAEFWRQCQAISPHPDRCFCLLHGVPCPEEQELASLRRQKATAPPGGRIVTVGRLIAERKHDLLIRAVARARKRFPSVRLDVVGGGERRGMLEQLARDLGAGDCVRVHGLVPRIADFLLDADLYVSPTTVDNFGTAVAEAAMYGLPVVTTRVGFPGELVVEGQTGYVVPPDDEDALYEAIVRVLARGPDEQAEMGRRMRQRALELGLTWPIAAAKAREIFQGCIDKKVGSKKVAGSR
jgi:glycosyltransferase involved in cell wall biosynthesis